MGQWYSVRFGCERVQDRIHVTSVNYNYYYFFVNEGYMKRKYPRRCTFLCMHITSRQQVDWSSAYGFVCDRYIPSSILPRGVKSPPPQYTVFCGGGPVKMIEGRLATFVQICARWLLCQEHSTDV